MKKTLAILFAIIFAFSSISLMAHAADASAEASAESNSESNIIIPETITLKNVSYVVCPYCDKVCGSSEAYASHLEKCAGYQSYKVEAKKNVCYYCGKEMKSEKALNEHYAYYVNVKEEKDENGNITQEAHVARCPYSGKFYKNDGCPCKFTAKAEYERHVAQCPYATQYSTLGYLRYIFSLIKDFFGSRDWGAVLGALKALIAGIGFGDVTDFFGTIIDTAKGFDAADFEGIGFDEIKGIFF